MTTTHETATLPLITPGLVYEGKYIDRSPTLTSAGKLTYLKGQSADQCLKTPRRPPSPPVIKRFREYFKSEPGAERVFYGTARDPHRIWASEIRHGIIPPLSESLKKTVNPDPLTLFQQKHLDKQEAAYYKHRVAPLGKTHDQSPGLPKGLDPLTFNFGKKTKLDVGVGTLVNPNKTYRQVHEENLVGLELYKKSHCNYDSGEQMTRSYTEPAFKKSYVFGETTPHYIDGRHARKTLHWLFNKNAEKETPLTDTRVDHLLEKTQPQIGKVLDPNLETRQHLPADHTYGVMLKTDGYGVGDLVHNRIPREYLRGKDRQRGLVSAVRQNIKKNNYHNFHDLLSAFRAYDKDCKGYIDIKDLREACITYDLPVETELLEQLLDYCDVDKTGVINYLEFANFLNWKDKIPSGVPKGAKLMEGDPVKPSDLDTKSPRSHESTPRRLQKQIDQAIGAHKTSAGMINAVIGPGSIDTRQYRSYGLPSVRVDKPAPIVQRVNDTTNYGNEADGNGLLNPSFFSNYGVHEVDLLRPREKMELLEIFTNIGVNMPYDTLSSIYDQLAAQHPRGRVSVETFRITS